MEKSHTFKFLDNELNQQLIALLKKAKLKHAVSKDGLVRYFLGDEEVVENDCIGSIRASVFPSWQVLTCPRDWTVRYKAYMWRHEIPFREELSNGELWFLLPRKHRPDRWKLDYVRNVKRAAMG